MPLKIVPWRTWGKDPPKLESKVTEPCSLVFFVNSNTRPCFEGHLCIGQAKYIQNLHTKRRTPPCPDVHYNFLIGGDGNVYEGRGWMVKPFLPQRYSRFQPKSIIIAFIGSFVVDKVLFVSGKEWRRHDPIPEQLERMKLPVPVAVITYTLKDPCFDHKECLREIKWTQKCHMFGSKLGDIRYNFLIGGDGAVYEGRGWNTRPDIPVKFQFIFDDCVYIGFMGRFKDEPPTERMMAALRWLLRFGVDHNYLAQDYREISLERGMPETGTGHRVPSIGPYIKQDRMGHFELHKHVYK